MGFENTDVRIASSEPNAAVMPSLDFLPVFNALPGANLLIAPDLRIVAASDDYLAATLTERATLVGQFIFDAFPDNPDTPEANAVVNDNSAPCFGKMTMAYDEAREVLEALTLDGEKIRAPRGDDGLATANRSTRRHRRWRAGGTCPRDRLP